MEKSMGQRGEKMQMAGPVGDASSSDQTAGGMELVPETPQKCFPCWMVFASGGNVAAVRGIF